MSRFNLETAVASWRQLTCSDRAISQDDADELECHLRDLIDDYTIKGYEREAAFRKAVQEIGDPVNLRRQYQDVYWKKLRAERKFTEELSWRFDMFKTQMIVAIRSMRKQFLFTTINIGGLALGLACCLTIFLLLQDEFSYDSWHENADRIVRVVEDLQTSGKLLHQGVSAPPMGPALVRDFPEVESMMRLRFGSLLLNHADRRFQEDGLLVVDSTMFKLFSFEVLEGDPVTALREPYCMALSKSMAQKYFGDVSPIGKALSDELGRTWRITAVVADPPENTHLQFDGLISFQTLRTPGDRLDEQWFSNGYQTYLLLQEGADLKALQDKIPAFLDRHEIGINSGNGSGYVQLPLIPLKDIRHSSGPYGGFGAIGGKVYLYAAAIVAIFILVIACINFINLATARSVRRAREVGVRKAIGAHRIQLIRQFLTEAFLTTIAAFLLAMLLFALMLPGINEFTEKALSLGDLFQAYNMLALAGILLAVTLVSGGYPAIILSGFQPVRVLKGNFSNVGQGARLRKTLVVFQFAVSMLLIVGTIVVIRQMDFLRQQDLGYVQEQMLIVNFNGDRIVRQQEDLLKRRFAAIPDVVGVSISRAIPGSGLSNLFTEVRLDNGEIRPASLNYYFVDEDFLDTYEIELLAGRNFSPEMSTDSSESMIINEAMLREFGWQTPESALGKEMSTFQRPMKVIGVIRDFHYRSLHAGVEPLGLFINPGSSRYMTLKIRTANMAAVLADIEREWSVLAAHRPYEASFLDDHFNRQYRSEEQLGQLFQVFALLAILIACLGLFGLTAFSIQQRQKEIGVRKVLGATSSQIMLLLSGDLLRLLAIAFVIAAPLAWLMMDNWLAEYAYRIELSPMIFIVAGFLGMLIAGLTVSYQVGKAALVNPVHLIRYE